jgi:hypothetical protein
MTHVRLTQLDGKLPNLALMRLSAFHKARGDQVHFYRTPYRQLGEPAYLAVYGSAIFDFTAERVRRFRSEFPDAIVGGTWDHVPGTEFRGPKVEDIIGAFAGVDYDPWPKFTASLGFSQRGCRFKCGHCGVWKKEGRAAFAAWINDIWRGEPWPKHLHLLDNDFFGVSKPLWKQQLADIRSGGFKVSFTQGINIRVITDEIAAELAATDYRDDSFAKKRLYTAWDSLGEEDLFFRGVDKLEAAGVPSSHLMVYMLVGEAPDETWAQVFHRFNRMVERGIKPFPMIYGDRGRTLPLGGLNNRIEHKTLANFQRWVLRAQYRQGVEFAAYRGGAKRDPLFKRQIDMFAEAAA